jgi:hypothetical protein
MHELDQPVDTELTRAARNSVGNINQVSQADDEFTQADFKARKEQGSTKKVAVPTARKKTRKAERQRKTKARKRK